MVRSYGMTLEDLEESLSEILPSGFEIKIVKGKVIVHTNLIENSQGDLVQFVDDLDDDEDLEEDELEEGYLDEEDSDD